MSVGWLVYSLAVGTLCAAGAWLAEGALRQRALPLRWAWIAALALTAALIASAPLRRSVPEPVALPAVVTVTGADAPAAARGGWLEEAVASARARMAAGQGAALALLGRVEAAGAGRAVLLAWGTASSAIVLLFGAVLLRSHRLRRRWPEVVVEGTPVRVSPEAGPFVAGLLRAEIVVPTWLLEAPGDERALVLAHESEHVRAKDPALLLIGCAVAALLPWHPAVWWMLSRLRLAVELDCDARVLRRGASRGSYGRLLLELAGRRGAPLLAAPALMDSPTHLERRIEAMTTKLPRFSLARSAAFGGLATLALLAACEAKMPTAPEIEKMDVAAAEKRVNATGLLALGDDANTTYTLDGEPITAEQARALDPKQIGSIEIQKTESRSGDGQAVKTAKIAISTPEAMAARGETAPKEVTTFRLKIPRDGASSQAANFDGLLMIDGVKTDPSRMRSIDSDQIVSMEVVKGAAATKLYDDPQAKNGVIIITTKQGAKK